jgi:hypothetical protein
MNNSLKLKNIAVGDLITCKFSDYGKPGCSGTSLLLFRFPDGNHNYVKNEDTVFMFLRTEFCTSGSTRIYLLYDNFFGHTYLDYCSIKKL